MDILNMEVVWALVGMLGLLILDSVLGASIAIKGGSFSWSELARTLKTNVLPYIVSLAALGGLASVARNGPMEGFFYTFSAAYSVKLLADLAVKVRELFSVNVSA